MADGIEECEKWRGISDPAIAKETLFTLDWCRREVRNENLLSDRFFFGGEERWRLVKRNPAAEILYFSSDTLHSLADQNCFFQIRLRGVTKIKILWFKGVKKFLLQKPLSGPRFCTNSCQILEKI